MEEHIENIIGTRHRKFLADGGEMGSLVRAKDWTQTPLGNPAGWPQSLLVTLHMILHSKFPMFLFWGPELTCFYNDAYRPSLGNSGRHPAALGQSGQDCWPDIWHIIKPFIDQVLAGGEPIFLEDQLIPIHRNGRMEDVYWTFTYSSVLDDNVQIAGVLMVCHEITENVLARQRLEESQQRLTIALESAQMGIWDYDPVSGTTIYSGRTQELFGFCPGDEITPELATAAIVEQDRERVGEAIRKVLQPDSGGVYDIEYSTANLHTGKRLTIRVKGKATFENRQPIRLIGTAIDITEEKNARIYIQHTNEELNKLLQEFTFVTDFMPQIVWSTHPNGYHDFFNRQWHEYTGLTYEQTKDTGWAQVVHPDDEERTWQVWQHSLNTGDTYEIEYRLRRADGHYGWFLGRAVPMRNEQGAITKWFGTCTDVSERKAHTEELKRHVAQRTQDLEEANRSLQRSNADLEQFAYVASHDLQEPLRKVTTVGSRLTQKYGDSLGDDGKMLLGIMTSAAERMKLLIESLLTFSRMVRKVDAREQIDLNQTMENIISDYELKIKETASRIYYDPLPVIEGVPQQIHQLFQNLLSNALKFAKPGVPPLIQIRSEPIDARQEPDMKLDGGQTYHRITFEDNGIGFEEEYAEKIFTIFQRLHGSKQYEGAGIGLSICRQVVANHEGDIRAEGRLGMGAVFTVVLPVQP